MRQLLLWSRRSILGVLSLVIPLALASPALSQGPLVVAGLNGPRGLSPSGSNLIVAAQGSGEVLSITPHGTMTVVTSGLPSETFDEDGTTVATGVTSAIEVGGTYFLTTGESAENTAGFDSVYSAKSGRDPVLIADLGAYEEANNVDGDVDETGAPELLVNAYDLVYDGAGGLYVVGSGANAVFHVTIETGDIATYAVFPNRDNPLFPAIGGPSMDQVPTGIEWGPDGALYLSTLTGFPFPQGEAWVYRLEDLNDDGDAMDEGETTVYADGLTAATNLAFDEDGSLLVTQFSLNMLEEAPGNLVRVENGAVSEVVAAPLITPTGVTVMHDGRIIVTQEFAGIVSEAEAGAEIAASAGPSEAEADGDSAITPPSTGSGGLMDSSAVSWVMLAALALLGLSASVGATVAARRSRY